MIMNLRLRLIFVFLMYFLYVPAGVHAQNVLSSKPAELQLMGETSDGKGIIVQSSDLVILYRPGIEVAGELALESLTTDDPEINKSLDSSALQKITFETTLPPDRFVFGQETEATFSSEATLYAEGLTYKFIIDFEISHSRISDTNTFLITGMGTLSLSDLGIMDLPGLKDAFRFQFRQNVTSRKY
jgi:hypothetical protein